MLGPSSPITKYRRRRGNRKLAASATEFVPSLNLKPQARHEQDREHLWENFNDSPPC